jgi:kumamolisin
MRIISRVGVVLAIVPLVVDIAVTGTADASTELGRTAVCSGQLLGNPGFETGAAQPWTESSQLVHETSDEEPPHTGEYFVKLAGTGDPHTDSVTQTVMAPADCHVTLSYWLHVHSAENPAVTTAYDELVVRANNKFESQVTNLDARPGYHEHTADLTEFAGQSLTISFTGSEDAGLQTSFVFDDVGLTLTQ